MLLSIYILKKKIDGIMLDPSFNSYFIDKNGSVLNVIDIKNNLNKKLKINLAQYSLNGHNDIFCKGYPNNFIFNMIDRISVHNGNLPEERVYNQNLLFPENVDRNKIYRLKQIANGMEPKDVDALIEKVKFISVSELLAHPHW
jgi:hypothetical protein